MSGSSGFYRFGDFLLDTRARELHRGGELVSLAVVALDCLVYLVHHRDRPVGRDELIAAVWGRAEISESTLAHTIVRLRQALGDNGNDQHSIRTLPRLGYRWVAPVTEVTDVVQDEMSESARPRCPAPVSRVPEPSRSRSFRRVALASSGLLVLGIVTWLWGRSFNPPQAIPSLHSSTTALQAALVHPAAVEAPEDWAWLHLGLMDLIANRLRQGQVPTLPSELAISLSNQVDRPPDELPEGVFLQVWPQARLKRGRWVVELEGQTKDGRQARVVAEAGDVLEAAQQASDKLLATLGKATPASVSGGSDELNSFIQQLRAARLGGRVADAMVLLQRAPSEWGARPEVQLMAARVDCDRGEYEACHARLQTLQARLSWQGQPAVYGEVLVSLAWLQANREQFGSAEEFLNQVIVRKRQLAGYDVLGNAYSLRGWLCYAQWRLTEASEDLGRARTIFLTTGNLRELARVDQRLGIVAERRGHLSNALSSLTLAERQFANIGARSDLMVTLMALAGAYEQRLEFDLALAATDRYWSADAASSWDAALYRAWALTHKGRLHEAQAVLAAAKESDPPGVPMLSAEGDALLARIALYRGEYAESVRLAKRAASLDLQRSDRRDYLANALVLIDALHGSGQVLEAEREVRHLRMWTADFDDDLLHAGASLAMAEQAWMQGHRQQAVTEYERAMVYAERVGIPDMLVAVGSRYAVRLIDSGQLERAGVISGRLSAWVQQDMRAAWVHARLLQALGNASAAKGAFRVAIRLAGERQVGLDSPFVARSNTTELSVRRHVPRAPIPRSEQPAQRHGSRVQRGILEPEHLGDRTLFTSAFRG